MQKVIPLISKKFKSQWKFLKILTTISCVGTMDLLFFFWEYSFGQWNELYLLDWKFHELLNIQIITLQLLHLTLLFWFWRSSWLSLSMKSPFIIIFFWGYFYLKIRKMWKENSVCHLLIVELLTVKLSKIENKHAEIQFQRENEPFDIKYSNSSVFISFKLHPVICNDQGFFKICLVYFLAKIVISLSP